MCICASRITLPTQNIMLTILNVLLLACAESSIRQHASWLPNGLSMSSCEGIVWLYWILAENKGPLCSSMGWECKKEWSRTNTEGTSSIISKRCHWGRPPKSHIKLTGRSCFKRQCTHMGFNNAELINYQWFSWASRIVCVLCIDGRASCFYASAGTIPY